MPRGNSRKPAAGAPALFGVSHRRGRVELAVGKACRAAYADGSVDPKVDVAAVTLAREVARTVDQAADQRDHWAVVAASRELREVLIRLGLDPRSRGTGADGVAEALAELAKPSTSDPAATSA